MTDFITPQHTLNVDNVKDHTRDVYDWTPKKDGYYIQVWRCEAWSKTGKLYPGLPPLGFHPNRRYEVEAYGDTLAATKSALGRKVPRWDLVDLMVHNFIENGCPYHERNAALQQEKQLSILVAPICLTGTIADAKAYAAAITYPAGGEGLVGRLRSNLTYFPGSRNKTQVKEKASCFFEATYLGRVGATAQANLTTETGITFSAKILSEKMSQSLIPGQTVTIRCMLINPSGAPRDPVIWKY